MDAGEGPEAARLAHFDFLSAGFRIWKEHMRLLSTVMMAPALSNSPGAVEQAERQHAR